MPPANVGMKCSELCRDRCSGPPRPGTACGIGDRGSSPSALRAATGPASELSGSVAHRFGGRVRHVRHHTSPGIWPRAHADVHRDARIAVQRAVVVTGRSLVDVVTAVHLPGRLVVECVVDVARGLRSAVVEDREVRRRRRAGRRASGPRAAPAGRSSAPTRTNRCRRRRGTSSCPAPGRSRCSRPRRDCSRRARCRCRTTGTAGRGCAGSSRPRATWPQRARPPRAAG